MNLQTLGGNPRGKELRAENEQATVVYRFIGTRIYIRKNSPNAGAEVIAKLRAGGARVSEGKGWLEIDLFNGRRLITLGAVTIDLEETPEQEVAEILCDFYKGILEAGNMTVEVRDI